MDTSIPDVADSFNNIGNVYLQKGDLGNALVQYQKALEIRTRVFGSDHPDVAASFYNIGNVYLAKGDLENALFQLNKGLDVFAAVMTMSRRRQTYVLLLFFTDFRDLCSIVTHKD